MTLHKAWRMVTQCIYGHPGFLQGIQQRPTPETKFNKLHHHGIRNNLLEQLGDFLIGRIQRIICDGESSAPATVISDVPQGTVLHVGQLLFLLDKRSAKNSTMQSQTFCR